MAFGIKIRFLGVTAMRRQLDRAQRRFGPEMEKNLRKSGEIVVSAAKREFRGNRTRALYEISKGRRRKREFPRPITSPPHMLGVWTGQYRKSITYDLRHKTRRTYAIEVGPEGIIYARAHEFGIGRMPQRQVLTPGVKKSERKVVQLLGTTFKVI